jgi:D-amino-acid dehydrogenase
LYRNDQSFASALKQKEFQKSLASLAMGGDQFALTGQQALELEPTLEGSEKSIIGAIHTPSECVVNTQKICDLLADSLRTLGVNFEMEYILGDLAKKASSDINTIWVVCAGAQSYDILRTFGVRVPVYPIKGYSITLPCQKQALPKLSITDSAIKTVFAPLADLAKPAIRVAGFAEIVGMNRDLDHAKIQALLVSTCKTFPRLGFSAQTDLKDIAPWAGLRPVTPTSIPIVGNLRGLPKNVLVNIGHGALGLTLAFGTAFELSQVISKPAGQL